MQLINFNFLINTEEWASTPFGFFADMKYGFCSVHVNPLVLLNSSQMSHPKLIRM